MEISVVFGYLCCFNYTIHTCCGTISVLVPSIGHYISDVYRPGSNLWKSYDDSTITEVCLSVRPSVCLCVVSCVHTV